MEVDVRGFRAAFGDDVGFTLSSAERGLVHHLLEAVGPSSSDDRQSSTAIKSIRRRIQTSDQSNPFR